MCLVDGLWGCSVGGRFFSLYYVISKFNFSLYYSFSPFENDWNSDKILSICFSFLLQKPSISLAEGYFNQTSWMYSKKFIDWFRPRHFSPHRIILMAFIVLWYPPVDTQHNGVYVILKGRRNYLNDKLDYADGEANHRRKICASPSNNIHSYTLHNMHMIHKWVYITYILTRVKREPSMGNNKTQHLLRVGYKLQKLWVILDLKHELWKNDTVLIYRYKTKFGLHDIYDWAVLNLEP